MARYDKIPLREWFAVGRDGQASRLRTIPDVTMGQHPEHPDLAAPELGSRCDACGYAPMVLLWHGHHGELSLCGHHANAQASAMESAGWIVIIDHRQQSADLWSNTVA